MSTLSRVGALVSKTVTVKPRPGNPPPRLAETASGMLNSIGLENKGADYFLAESLPRMREIGTRVVVNVGGESLEEFVELAERFSAVLGPGIFALTATMTGSTRTAILSVLVFFIVGGFLLARVDVESGRAVARRLSEEASAAGGAG